MQRAHTVAGGLVITLGLLTVMVPSAIAHERYSDGCNNCHGDFRGPVSPLGTIFPDDDKHEMHRASSSMDADCNLCHDGGGFSDPLLGSSLGTALNPGVGCSGCHGRDYGGTIGNRSVGLRAHHAAAGIESCAGCHGDDPDPLPENVLPTYYGTADTNVGDPCNSGPDFRENWSIGDTLGLDNDGDLAYDGDDPDCSASCLGDIDGSSDVAFGDLLIVLSNWGVCPGCPADLDGDDMVAFSDLLIVLSNWGPC